MGFLLGGFLQMKRKRNKSFGVAFPTRVLCVLSKFFLFLPLKWHFIYEFLPLLGGPGSTRVVTFLNI